MRALQERSEVTCSRSSITQLVSKGAGTRAPERPLCVSRAVGPRPDRSWLRRLAHGPPRRLGVGDRRRDSNPSPEPSPGPSPLQASVYPSGRRGAENRAGRGSGLRVGGDGANGAGPLGGALPMQPRPAPRARAQRPRRAPPCGGRGRGRWGR